MPKISLLLATIFGLLAAQHISKSVIFKRMQQNVSPSRSTCVVTLVYELDAVALYILSLSEDIVQAQKLIDEIEIEYRSTIPQTSFIAYYENDAFELHTQARRGFVRVIKELKTEFTNLAEDHSRLTTEMRDYQFLSTRSKRSLVPIFGKILGSLIGVATEGEIRVIKNGVKRLHTTRKICCTCWKIKLLWSMYLDNIFKKIERQLINSPFAFARSMTS